MRRGSIIGPLILIVIGILFLVRNVWREIPLADILSRYWPYLLIAWGIIRLIEIFWWALKSKPLPAAGVSGGEWMLVVLICILGAGIYAASHSNWLPTMRAWRGVVMDLGQSYEFQLNSGPPKPCPKNCRVLIEGFQGNVRISGGANDGLVIAVGKETVRAFNQTEAQQVSKQTSLELVQQGSQIIVRANQGGAIGRLGVSAELDLSVPADASIEAQGRFGDFNIRDVSALELQGPTQDLELDNISGPVKVDDARITLHCASLPGEVRITSGDVVANNIGGPAVLNGRSSDVRISGVTQSLELTLDRGDIELRPGKAVPKMVVRTRSGDIDLALAPDSKFDLNASTERGEARNDFGGSLNVSASRRGGTITGTVPGGPQLRLETGRGDITVRKANSDETDFPETPRLPRSTDQPLHIERQ